jgi:hypothetical protein
MKPRCRINQRLSLTCQKVLETWGLLNWFEARFTFQTLICAMAKKLQWIQTWKEIA